MSLRFDLEDPAAVARLADPMLALGGLRGLVILDEVQNRPELFPSLRVLADRRPVRTRFLVLGSASPQLLRQSSESLAGRIAYHLLPGLGLAEVPDKQWNRLWLRGGFPRAFLVRSEAECFEWLEQFLRTFLERELPQFGISAGAQAMRRFWSMLAHGHGQLWNASEIGRSMGLSDTTVRSYLDKMADAYVMRELQPWHENLGKRQVKAPKIYVRDTGLLHALLDIRSGRQLETHSKVGASWGGFRHRPGDPGVGCRAARVLFLAHPCRCGAGPAGGAWRAADWRRGEADDGTRDHAIDEIGDDGPETQPAVCRARGGGNLPDGEKGTGGRVRGPFERGRGTEIGLLSAWHVGWTQCRGSG